MAIEIVDLPIKNGGSFHSFLYVYQRVQWFAKSSQRRGFSFHVACHKHQRLVGWDPDFGGSKKPMWIPWIPWIPSSSPTVGPNFMEYQLLGPQEVTIYIYNIYIYIIQCYWIITYNTYINSWNPQKACKKLLYKHLICPYYPPNRKWVIDKPLSINHIDRLISMHLPK